MAPNPLLMREVWQADVNIVVRTWQRQFLGLRSFRLT